MSTIVRRMGWKWTVRSLLLQRLNRGLGPVAMGGTRIGDDATSEGVGQENATVAGHRIDVIREETLTLGGAERRHDDAVERRLDATREMTEADVIAAETEAVNEDTVNLTGLPSSLKISCLASNKFVTNNYIFFPIYKSKKLTMFFFSSFFFSCRIKNNNPKVALMSR